MIAIKIFTRTQMKRGWLHSTKMNIYTKQKYAKKTKLLCCVYILEMTCLIAFGGPMNEAYASNMCVYEMKK